MLLATQLGRTSRDSAEPSSLRRDSGLGENGCCWLEPPPALGVAIRASAKPILCHPTVLQSKMGLMAVLMLPLLLLGISGLLFIYQEASRLWSKSAVQNKVVVITDAISGLGKGKLAFPGTCDHLCPQGTWRQDGGGAYPLVERSQLLFRSLKLSCQVNGRVRMAGVANSQFDVRRYWV